MSNVTITVDEARKVYVHILAVVDIDGPLDQGSDKSIGIVAAFSKADNAIALSSSLVQWTGRSQICTCARCEHCPVLIHR